jgi:hypothetical protein
MSAQVPIKALTGLPESLPYLGADGKGATVATQPHSSLRLDANNTPVCLPAGVASVVLAGTEATLFVACDLPAASGVRFTLLSSTQSDDEAAAEQISYFAKNKQPGTGFDLYVASQNGSVFATLNLHWECV